MALPPAYIHHLQWSNGPYRTCEPVQPEDGRPLKGRGLDVQNISF